MSDGTEAVTARVTGGPYVREPDIIEDRRMHLLETVWKIAKWRPAVHIWWHETADRRVSMTS
jgi:hypothetical protein